MEAAREAGILHDRLLGEPTGRGEGASPTEDGLIPVGKTEEAGPEVRAAGAETQESAPGLHSLEKPAADDRRRGERPRHLPGGVRREAAVRVKEEQHLPRSLPGPEVHLPGASRSATEDSGAGGPGHRDGSVRAAPVHDHDFGAGGRGADGVAHRGIGVERRNDDGEVSRPGRRRTETRRSSTSGRGG